MPPSPLPFLDNQVASAPSIRSKGLADAESTSQAPPPLGVLLRSSLYVSVLHALTLSTTHTRIFTYQWPTPMATAECSWPVTRCRRHLHRAEPRKNSWHIGRPKAVLSQFAVAASYLFGDCDHNPSHSETRVHHSKRSPSYLLPATTRATATQRPSE